MDSKFAAPLIQPAVPVMAEMVRGEEVLTCEQQSIPFANEQHQEGDHRIPFANVVQTDSNKTNVAII